MKHIEDIRRENLTMLAKELGGVAALSRRLSRSESQVSQWIRGATHSVTGRKRGMKSETARWIEETTGKPEGWLDRENTAHISYRLEESEAPEYFKQPVTRPLIQNLCELASQIDDEGLKGLVDVARCFVKTHPRLKAKAA